MRMKVIIIMKKIMKKIIKKKSLVFQILLNMFQVLIVLRLHLVLLMDIWVYHVYLYMMTKEIL